jgi:hypothetical protein
MGAAGHEIIQVIAYDPGIQLESFTAPATAEAGTTITATVNAVNAGHQVWREGMAVVWEWFQWDGRTTGQSGTFALSKAVSPGERIKVEAPVVVPEIPGSYRLACTVATEGSLQFSWRSGRRQAEGLVTVSVTAAKIKSVDLTQYFSVNAIATDVFRSRADFDGRGNSLPAEFVPPDKSNAPAGAYPSSYYILGGPSSIPFAYPEANSGLGQAVACNGQQLALGDSGAKQIHLAIASTEGPQEAAFVLRATSGTTQEMKLTVPGWNNARPEDNTTLALRIPFVRTLSADDITRSANIYHLKLTPAAPAITLELPRAPWIKILAVTVETP